MVGCILFIITFSKSADYFREFFWEFFGNSLGTVTDCLHFQKSTCFIHFQSKLIVYNLKVS